MRGFLIGGVSSGVGKTTVTMALSAAFRQRGLVVQAFKGGPDFLDTTHHSRVSGRTARNLDTWMMDAPTNRKVLGEASHGADVVVVEGMMGLFDGKEATTDKGSSAEIARLIGLPVVLVVDAAKSARSAAAVVLGFERFDPRLQLAGVVLNRVAGERHFGILKAAIESACETPVLGWMPRDPSITIAERHLGLEHAFEQAGADEELVSRLALVAEASLDVEGLLRLTFTLPAEAEPTPLRDARVRIGVARDAAFSFYYEDNLDLLREEGAHLVPFSPMTDTALPEGLDALYFGGGYPELHAEILSGNRGMLASVASFCRSGRPVYAECGGMIYLSRMLRTRDEVEWPMVGALELAMEMTPKLVDFGYVTVTLTRDCLLGPAGTEVRGHSFHYSKIVSRQGLDSAYDVLFSLGGKRQDEGFMSQGVLASYVHLHFRANPAVARRLVEAALLFAEHMEVTEQRGS